MEEEQKEIQRQLDNLYREEQEEQKDNKPVIQIIREKKTMTEIKLKELFYNDQQEDDNNIEQTEEQENHDQEDYNRQIIKSVNINSKHNEEQKGNKKNQQKEEQKQLKYKQFMIDKKELEIQKYKLELEKIKNELLEQQIKKQKLEDLLKETNQTWNQ